MVGIHCKVTLPDVEAPTLVDDAERPMHCQIVSDEKLGSPPWQSLDMAEKHPLLRVFDVNTKISYTFK
jgi:hypothetical protein